MRHSGDFSTPHHSSSLTPASGPAPQLDEVVQLIRENVQRQPTPILGTHLAAVIRGTFPTFRYHQFEAGRLREFLEKHVPEVALVGRQGGDVLYAWRTNEAMQPVRTPAPAPQVRRAEETWRAFSSPNSQRIVIMQVNVESGAWRSVDPATPESAEWRNVPPLPAEEHRAIAKRFLGSLGDDERRAGLEPLIGQPRWWIAFRDGLARHGNLETSYRIFRFTELVSALTDTLRRVGLSEPALDAALAPITPPIRPRERRELTSKGALRDQGSDGHPTDASFRAFALRILGQLPLRELREVSVRLGDVFDALEPR